MPARPGTKPLLPVTIQPGGVRYAPGIRAGRWVFATGHKGTAEFGGACPASAVLMRLAWESPAG